MKSKKSNNILELHELLKEIEYNLNYEDDKWYCLLCFKNLGIDIPEGFGCPKGKCSSFYCRKCFVKNKILQDLCIGCVNKEL